MKVGDRVYWLLGRVPKRGKIETIDQTGQTADLIFMDGSTRGTVPWTQIEVDNAPTPWIIELESGADIAPRSIESEEELGGF